VSGGGGGDVKMMSFSVIVIVSDAGDCGGGCRSVGGDRKTTDCEG